MWSFVQRTGNLYRDNGDLAWTGYAGGNKGASPEAVNNPAMQDVVRTGPLPRGFYTIGEPYHHATLGPCTMNLTPDESNEMFGRAKFRIHGDNIKANHSASEGCIVKSPKANRQMVWDSGDHRLRVVAEEADRVTIEPSEIAVTPLNNGGEHG